MEREETEGKEMKMETINLEESDEELTEEEMESN